MLPMALGPVSPDQTNVRSIGSSSPRISTKRRRHQSPGGTVPPFADLPFADLLFVDLPFADPPFADPPIVATCGAWELLPNEVILRVLAHCAAAELCQLAYTATLLRDLSGSDRLWRRLFRAQFPETVPISSDGEVEEQEQAPAGWKRRYAQETLAHLRRRNGFGTVFQADVATTVQGSVGTVVAAAPQSERCTKRTGAEGGAEFVRRLTEQFTYLSMYLPPSKKKGKSKKGKSKKQKR